MSHGIVGNHLITVNALTIEHIEEVSSDVHAYDTLSRECQIGFNTEERILQCFQMLEGVTACRTRHNSILNIEHKIDILVKYQYKFYGVSVTTREQDAYYYSFNGSYCIWGDGENWDLHHKRILATKLSDIFGTTIVKNVIYHNTNRLQMVRGGDKNSQYDADKPESKRLTEMLQLAAMAKEPTVKREPKPRKYYRDFVAEQSAKRRERLEQLGVSPNAWGK